MPQYDFDLITIGAGSGGVRGSRLASRFGAKTAIIEESRTGGTCVMRGCVPKKLLVYGAHYGQDLKDAEGFGWSVPDAVHSWPDLIAAKDKELDRLESVYHRILRDSGVEEIDGRGVLTDPHSVEVNGKTLTAEKILIATGGWPSIPATVGTDAVITSNEALDLKKLPEKILIVGGGYIAVEFAGIFNGLGSEVHLILRSGNILRGFDDDVRSTLAEEMEAKGVRIHRDCIVHSIEERADGKKSVMADFGEELVVDEVMYATGRAPNTANLGLEAVGVEMNDRGAIVVNDEFRTTQNNIFALGDVTDRVQLTPVAIEEAHVWAETQFDNRPRKMNYDNIATAVFSQPPIGTVGLTEDQARKNHDVRIFMSRFKNMKHTLSGRNERTMMKLIVDKKTDRVLGIHMVGDDAPELVQGLAVAVTCGATKAQFDATMGIHPTAGEEFVTMRDPVPESAEV